LLVHFLSVARKKTEPKERARKRPVSEAGTQILQITQRTRYAQTAFRISLLRLRPAIRDSISIQRICIPLKTSSCGMFSRSYRIEERWNTVQLRERQAFSVVGVKEIWRTPKGWTKSTLSGQRLESHTKILMERASSRNQLHPPHIGAH